MSTAPSSPDHGYTPSTLEIIAEKDQPTPEDGTLADVGLEVRRDNNSLFITVTPLDPPGRPRSMTVAETSAVSASPASLPSPRIRWVAHNLTTAATMLAQVGIRVRDGLCLDLTQNIVDNITGTPAPTSREDLALDRRYTEVNRAVADLRDRADLAALVALDSRCALLAAELNAAGVPWHHRLYEVEMARLAGAPSGTTRYPRLDKLNQELRAAFGGALFDWERELPDAFHGEGIAVPHGPLKAFLESVDHPAGLKLLRYREIERITAMFGYDWAQRWISNGQWWPLFRPAGTVSGRWSGQGGAVQLPRMLRGCVQVPEGRILIRADLAQAEPRMWAHLSSDLNLLAALERGDLYEDIAKEFSWTREEAKLAVLAALYGRRDTASKAAWRKLSEQFPEAMNYLGWATNVGQNGRALLTRLGRAFPAPDTVEQEAMNTPEHRRDTQMRKAVSARGRRARNFVIQAAVAEFTSHIATSLRLSLAELDARLVLIQHDEFLVDADRAQADEVELAVLQAIGDACAWVLGGSRVSWPMAFGRGQSWAEATADSMLR
ncbi:DNA polymerase-1 [Crossiella equi]|uniref:DNA-directed DNA polymerase n=1 Tax=Crossiella equi TaxID=130796 RepID=A0ABS5ALZ7_9PSEU|nr:DNA polymerase [Crossiella equi]MBP2477589.1 DNA polymerase-1 [Crossiella equi]